MSENRGSALFTDLYQLTMAEAYFAAGNHNANAIFELFFRRCPFGGEYAVLAGYDLVREIVENFHFTESDLIYLKSLPTFANADPKFFETLRTLDLNDVEILGAREGDLIFPRVPLLQVRGPILKAQLLESALLNAINFSTLVATCARRIWMIAKPKGLVEFGLRRAQGPNGAMTATRSSYLGGFSATSNVLAGKILGLPVVGTMAHSYVQSSWEARDEDFIWNGKSIAPLLEEFKKEDGRQTHAGELSAFLSFAKVFPDRCVLLVDTYDTIESGIPNAIRIFKILKKLGHAAGGIRLDSGDLVYLSKEARKMLDAENLQDVQIYASNELDEDVIESLQDQGGMVDHYAVGTQLVTAAIQPSLGGVYKLVEVDGNPRMKISQQTEKMVLPCAKKVFRLFGEDGKMILDLLAAYSDETPRVGKEILAMHPSDPFKRALVVPSRVEEVLQPIFQNGKWIGDEKLSAQREWSLARMETLRADISRRRNPTPYKVSLTAHLKSLVDELYNRERPPVELR